MAEAKWTMRLSRAGMKLAVAALVIGGLGLLLARYDVVPKLAGFTAMLGGGLLAAIAGVLALIGLLLNLRHPTTSRAAAIIGLVLALPYAGFLLSRPSAAGDVPAIHDITTDLVNPPVFKRLVLRADNLTGVETVENWRKLHSAAYADLQPVTIAKPAAAVLADAERIARAQGWDVVAVDPGSGQLEATASVSFIRFKDDVAVRITPNADGASSTVDMRSVSRIGVSDLGVNAKRIRAFLKELTAG